MNWVPPTLFLTQAGDLFRRMSADKQQELIDNIVTAMSDVPLEIQCRQIMHFMKADASYRTGVARGLGIDVETVASAA